MSSKQKILLVMLEFATWERGRAWGYTTNFAIEKALAANNVECLILPALSEAPSDSPASWLSRGRQLLEERQFDQVWLWLVHATYDPDFIEWIAGLAPVRVGWLGESLEYHPDEYSLYPHLKARRQAVEEQVRQMTHVLAVDEHDAAYINERKLSQAIWVPMAVLEQNMTMAPVPSMDDRAAFFGSIYGERERWLRLGQANDLITIPPPPENSRSLPELFDNINSISLNTLTSGKTVTFDHLTSYINALRAVRQECFELWMADLATRLAVVNLPSFGKVYTSRVVEAMGAGTPAISWEIPDRPRNRELFQDGREILLYRKDQPEMLAEHVHHLQRDRGFARKIAINAQRKVWRLHTWEKRMQQILHWLSTGVEPVYTESDEPSLLQESLESFSSTFKLKHDAANAPTQIVGAAPSSNQQAAPDSANKERDNYYSQLFLQDPTWSSPHPNEDEQARWTKISRFIKLAQIAAKMKGQTIGRMIEVGCGRGWLSNLASQLAPCEGIDPVADVIAVARHHYPALRFRSGTMEEVLASPGFTPYDAVLCTEVIEHVPRPAQAGFVCTMARLIRPGGFVIITTPRAEAFDAWMAVTNNSRQPVDDWLSEDELSGHFATAGFTAIGSDRIHVSLRNFGYLLTPTTEQLASPEVLPLYQVAAFQLSAVQNDSETPP